MILNFIKLVGNSVSGFIISYINLKQMIVNFTDIAGGVVGVCVGLMTLVYLYYQVKKIKKGLKK